MLNDWGALLVGGAGLYIGYKVFRDFFAPAMDAPGLTVRSLYLRLGDRGPDVRALQTALNFLGYPVGQVDGIFGQQTQEALRRFQQDERIANDGVAGPVTYQTLDERLRERGGYFIF